MSKLTKAMLAKCQNSSMQAFCALDKDVQDAILNNHKYAQCAQSKFLEYGWGNVGIDKNKIEVYVGSVYRLSPNTPTDPEYVEYGVESHNNGNGFYETTTPCGIKVDLYRAACHCKFLGIIYNLNGTETLRTSVDAAFGTPVRVRFAK